MTHSRCLWLADSSATLDSPDFNVPSTCTSTSASPLLYATLHSEITRVCYVTATQSRSQFVPGRRAASEDTFRNRERAVENSKPHRQRLGGGVLPSLSVSVPVPVSISVSAPIFVPALPLEAVDAAHYDCTNASSTCNTRAAGDSDRATLQPRRHNATLLSTSHPL